MSDEQAQGRVEAIARQIAWDRYDPYFDWFELGQQGYVDKWWTGYIDDAESIIAADPATLWAQQWREAFERTSDDVVSLQEQLAEARAEVERLKQVQSVAIDMGAAGARVRLEQEAKLYEQLSQATEALRLAALRLEILTGRMRGCHEETGKHELLDEAEMFCRSARDTLKRLGAP